MGHGQTICIQAVRPKPNPVIASGFGRDESSVPHRQRIVRFSKAYLQRSLKRSHLNKEHLPVKHGIGIQIKFILCSTLDRDEANRFVGD
jgi:hypothetical protein